MSDHLPPRVTVRLPGGVTVEGRLHARRQQDGGHWVYDVLLPIPAAAVQQIDGEDYAAVPTERAGTWVLATLPPAAGETTPRMVLHTVACWIPSGRTTRATDDEARFHLKHGWATACDQCQPAP